MSSDMNEHDGSIKRCPVDGSPCEGQGTDADCYRCQQSDYQAQKAAFCASCAHPTAAEALGEQVAAQSARIAELESAVTVAEKRNERLTDYYEAKMQPGERATQLEAALAAEREAYERGAREFAEFIEIEWVRVGGAKPTDMVARFLASRGTGIAAEKGEEG